MKTFAFRLIVFVVVSLASVVYGAGSRVPQLTQADHYQVSDLPSLGGASGGISINNKDLLSGFSITGEGFMHATLWRDSEITDLDTLGGPYSAVLWPVKNTRGLIVGVSETSDPNPLGEAWSCSNFFPSVTGNICVGFAWMNGAMRPLPTLGGYNGFAAGANRSGQIVGWAENTVHDSTCTDTQVLQFRAVAWGPQENQVQELLPLPQDTTSAATAINDWGQVAGISGICGNSVGGFSAAHAVLWEDGVPTDIGTLGGVAWNTPMAINSHGDVVGFSNVSAADGGAFNAHAFLWTREGGMQDLGTLPNHVISQALGINKWGQIVGMSCATIDFRGCRAFLYENGEMKDLTNMASPAYPGRLIYANDINDDGKITGAAFNSNSLTVPAFVAVPATDPESGISLEGKSGGSNASNIDLPESLRRIVFRRLGLAGVPGSR